MAETCNHLIPVFGCLSCIARSKIPKTDGGADEHWICPNCGMRHPYSRVVCDKAFKKGGLTMGRKGCGYDRRIGRVQDGYEADSD